LSLLVHALFAALFLWLVHERALHPPQRTLWVEVVPRPRNPNAAKEQDNNHRIVQSNQGREAREAAPDAFLGEKTRIVDRQTVNSRKTVEMGHAGTPAKTLTQTQPREKKTAQSQPKGEPATDQKSLSRFGLAILPDARRKGASEELAKDEPEWANIGAQPQDYVDGIKESDRTALDTREYLYFGYHQRIRQRLELEWTRMLRDVLMRFYRNGRTLASDTEYTTRLVVILNDKGEITRIKVLSVSGTQELDDVAVAAFNKAGPFPNPPKGLVKNGEVEVPWELKLRS
jgi:protein TonB